jgi:hypothetical protein
MNGYFQLNRIVPIQEMTQQAMHRITKAYQKSHYCYQRNRKSAINIFRYGFDFTC